MTDAGTPLDVLNRDDATVSGDLPRKRLRHSGPNFAELRRMPVVRWREVPEYLAVLLSLFVWARYAAAHDGGRRDDVMLKMLCATAPGLLLTRPWVHVSSKVLALAVAVPGSAALICALDTFQWSSPQMFFSFTWASMLLVTTVAFARTPARRQAIAGAVILAGVDGFAQGWMPWWGGGDPARPMLGTLSHYNPFGASLVSPTLLALSLALLGRGRVRLVGWVCVPFGFAGILYSTSRGSLMAFTGGAALLLLAAVVHCGGLRRRIMMRFAALGALTYVLTAVLTSKWVFGAQGKVPFAALTSRSADITQTLAGHSEDRLLYMKAAIRVFFDAPFTGHGLGSFAPTSSAYLPVGKTTLSPYVHNGVLQAFAEGGLLHGVPVLLTCLALCIIALRRLCKPVKCRAEVLNDLWLPVGAAAATLAALAHALIDFDWAWPTVLGSASIVGGLLLASHSAPKVGLNEDASDSTVLAPKRPSAFGWACVGLLLSIVTLACAATISFSKTTKTLEHAYYMNRNGNTADALRYLDSHRGWLSDSRIDGRIVDLAVNGSLDNVSVVPKTLMDHAIVAYTPRAILVPESQSLLIQATWTTGHHLEALAQAEAFAIAWRTRRPVLATPYIGMLYASGQKDAANAYAAALLAGLYTPNFNGGYPFSYQHTTEILQLVLAHNSQDSQFLRCVAWNYNEAYKDIAGAPAVQKVIRPNATTPVGIPCELD